MPTDQLVRTNKKLVSFFKPQPFINYNAGQFTVKLARTETEIEHTLKLRYKVFNLELNEGLASSHATGKDEDIYDSQCDHLIIQDNITHQIVGTYRLQTQQMAENGTGFYSASEFQLSMLGNRILRNSLELGRACVLNEYRNTRVLFLLWKGIAEYMLTGRKRYLFGCCSLNSTNSDTGNSLYHHLLVNNHIDHRFALDPQPGYGLETLNSMESPEETMPPLMRMYFRYGGKIIGKPAIDREFGTIDYFMLLDTYKLSAANSELFFGRKQVKFHRVGFPYR